MVDTKAKNTIAAIDTPHNARIVVVTKDGSIRKCISINQTPEQDSHYYQLEDGDVAITKYVNGAIHGQRFYAFARKPKEKPQLVSAPCNVEKLMFKEHLQYNEVVTEPLFKAKRDLTLNEEAINRVVNDAFFKQMLTHKYNPEVAVRNIDHLTDAPSFVFEIVETSNFELRNNEINVRLTCDKENKTLKCEGILTIQDKPTEPFKELNDFYLSRSLRRPLRLAFRSSNLEHLDLAKELVAARLAELKLQYTTSNLRWGQMFVVTGNADV